MYTCRTIYHAILDIIFPRACLGCGAESTWLCSSCWQGVSGRHPQVCPYCKKSGTGICCPACQGRGSLDGLLVAAAFGNKTIQSLIHTLKYSAVSGIAPILGSLLVQTLTAADHSTLVYGRQHAIITSVPLHPRRYRERGFNQASLLAQHVSSTLHIPIAHNIIQRVKYTSPQAQLTRQQRLHNLDRAFQVKSLNFSGKNVIIIDDVATTMTTLMECATVLKQRTRCQSVWGLVIARGT